MTTIEKFICHDCGRQLDYEAFATTHLTPDPVTVRYYRVKPCDHCIDSEAEKAFLCGYSAGLIDSR